MKRVAVPFARIGVLLHASQNNAPCGILQHQCRTMAMHVSEDLPRITVPHKTYARLQKLKQQNAASKSFRKPVYKSPLVIACKRDNFNHHRGQTYSDFGHQTLASHGWKHRKSHGDYFTLVCHDRNPALDAKEKDKSFYDLHLQDEVVEAVQALGLNVPTNIQSSAIPAILDGTSTICAAETGSGKTLAYLLPVVDMLLKRLRHRGNVERPMNTPSVIILTPSRELADQIEGVIKSLQAHLDFTAYSVCGGRGTKARLVWPVKRPMDILISTPGVLRKLLIAGQIKSSGLQQIILDEADTLLDDSFMDTVDRVFHRLQIPVMESGKVSQEGYTGGVQFLLVSATMPRGLVDSIGTYVPVDILRKITSSGLHRLMPHVPQKFLRLLSSQKPEELVKIVKRETEHPNGSMMIFCNKSSTCFYLDHILKEHGIKPAIINGEMQEKNRHGVFERFQSGHYDILLATDVASRGLDTLNVRHVINYDFPNFVSDYIHRAGRVGRVGSSHSGLVTSFITHKWEVEVLWQIEIAARKSTDLHNVNANIKRKLEAEYAKQHGSVYR